MYVIAHSSCEVDSRMLLSMYSLLFSAHALPSQKQVQNNGSRHWNPTNSSSFVFHMFQSAKRILEAEHARKLPDSGEGDKLVVMHVELSSLIFTLAHT